MYAVYVYMYVQAFAASCYESVSTFIDVYLGNSTRPLNVDFSRLQHPAPNVDFCRHLHSKI